MERKRIVPLIIGAVVVVAVAAAGIYFATNPTAWQDVSTQLELAEPASGHLEASGFIEAEEVDIAPELGGRIAELAVEEGQDVEAGQRLVRLDGALLEAQIASQEAAIEVAKAELAQVKAGARPEQIEQAEAALAQAEAARDGAYQAWQDAIAIRDNPQELNARIAQAQAQVEANQAALQAQTAMKDAAEVAYDNFWDAQEKIEEARKKIRQIPEPQRPPMPDLPPRLDFHLIPNQYWKAWVGVNSADAQYQGAEATLNNLYRMRSNPQDLDAQVDAAEAQYQTARATVEKAAAQVEALKAGATAEEIAAVEAQVQQARAKLNTLLAQRDKLTIDAPVGGLILELSIREGELAAPGGTLLTLGNLDEVTLTVYVPENQLGKVNVGQEVEVSVDSFPERTFHGHVVAIASEAEFTPRNVQTKEERVNMVFAVEVSIPNENHDLKPGMPADAVIITEEQ
jgi:multidrug efflux pump subunit AcrA (membrane-fusion protein)